MTVSRELCSSTVVENSLLSESLRLLMSLLDTCMPLVFLSGASQLTTSDLALYKSATKMSQVTETRGAESESESPESGF